MTLTPTVAAERAARNFEANCAAMNSHFTPIEDVEWIFGRDGALTALDAQASWISGCSLPRRAAMTQLRKMEVHGAAACFLAPPHAAAVRVALDRLRPEQACIAIVPDTHDMQLMLHCDDFSGDIRANRLFVACGIDWKEQLVNIFDVNAGLSIPTQFIRLPTTAAELIEPLIGHSQDVFSAVTTRRSHEIESLRRAWRPVRGRQQLCIVAPSRFRLWNNWGEILVNALHDDAHVVRIDPDDPIQTSPLIVAQQTSMCDAVVTIDLCRADVGGVVSDAMPWLTWCVNGRIPARETCGKSDRILVLDEHDLLLATQAGWEAREVQIAVPPARSTLPTCDVPARPNERFIALVVDNASLEPPTNIDDFSSHRVLWERVAQELVQDPFAVGDDPEAYLQSRMREFQISEQTLSREKFMANLVVPAYQQGIARILRDSGLPCRPDLDGACAIAHVWPNQQRRHAIDFAGLPVIRPGRTAAELVRRAKAAIHDHAASTNPCGPVICGKLIRDLLPQI